MPSKTVIAVAGLLALSSLTGASAETPSWPARVTAVYSVKVAGIELGKFHYRSEVDKSAYRLAGYAKLSWGFGMFKWYSNTNSSGSLAGDGIHPAAYSFDYRSSKKKGSVAVKFNRAGVSSVKLVPPRSPEPGQVPLSDKHLEGVFDPMSALIALSRISGGNPCGRRISIFDGKQRFELVLSFRRQERLREKRPSGQPLIAYICGVRYIPVAGHKNNKETKAMAASKGIEVALRPVPSANLAVPVRITIPTPVGSVDITADAVDITATGNRQIALSH